MTEALHISDEARRATAADWVVRLSTDQVSLDDALDFDAWLDASPANVRAYDDALAAWHELGAAASLTEQARPLAANRSRTRPAWAAAAGLAAALAFGIVLLPTLKTPRTEAFSTATGERRTVTLADGTVIEMNAASRLAVTMTRDTRRVSLSDGEAVFDVAKDARRPFLVTAGDRTVRVVGTRFDIRRRDGVLSVTVDRGAVEVRPTSGATGQAYRLRPGQQFVRREGADQARVGAADPAAVSSWRSGKLVVRDQPLSEVAAELNRQFARPIVIEDPALARTPVSGVLVLDDQDAVVRRLALLLPIKVLPTKETIRLQRDTAAQP